MTILNNLELSNKQIAKIGKKFRDSVFDQSDLNFLENYRNSFNGLLLNCSNSLANKIKESLKKFVLVGRLKRIYSIIRKLQRKNNYGMDLSRMSDVAGLRIIVEKILDQNIVLDIINKNFEVEKIYDYRNDIKLYRSIHVILKKEGQFVEIQIRTLAQQTWADESEAFGEQVKYGKFSEEIKAYLSILHDLTKKIDDNNYVYNNDIKNMLFHLKSPIEGKYKKLLNSFRNIPDNLKIVPAYYLIVYDSADNTLVSEDKFSINESKDIFNLYQYKTKILNQNRFEIIFFISTLGKEILRISHPRFFIQS